MRLTHLIGIIPALLALACGGRAEESFRGTGDDPPPSTGGSTSGTDGSSGGAPGDGDTDSASGGPFTGGSSTGGTFGEAASGGAPGEAGAFGSGGNVFGSGGHPVGPDEVGHLDTSCGAYMWTLDEETFLDCRVGGEHEFHPECVLVDCTAYGDINAVCVFSNHCFCSEGFVCEGGQTWVGAECHPRFSCVPAM